MIGKRKQDGSGKGIRANRGRGGCTPPEDKSQDSKYFEDWIAGCIRKHVKGSEKPKLTREQCLAAAYGKLRKGEISRKTSGDSFLVVFDINTDSVEIIDLVDPNE